MKKITEQTIEEVLRRAGTEPVPVLMLRKNALKKGLTKRIVVRQSPYLPFMRVFIPAVLIVLVLFIGNERKNALPDEIVTFLTASQFAVSQIPSTEKDLLSTQAGVDLPDILSMIEKGTDVSFVEGVSNFEAAGEPAVMMMVAPVSFKTTEESVSNDESEVQVTARAMNASYDATASDPISYTTQPFLPVTFIRFKDASGKVFIAGFDERSVPVSLVAEIQAP